MAAKVGKIPPYNGKIINNSGYNVVKISNDEVVF